MRKNRALKLLTLLKIRFQRLLKNDPEHVKNGKPRHPLKDRPEHVRKGELRHPLKGLPLHVLKDKPLSFQLWIAGSILNSIIVCLALAASLICFRQMGILQTTLWNGPALVVLLQIVLCVAAVNTVAAKYIAHRLTRPVHMVEEKMKSISCKRWDPQIVAVDRQDEIGNLVNALVNMQSSLMELEEEEEFFLQSVSHGLKTPIMVIKNCCQALRDKIYINDSEEETIAAIEAEAAGLEDAVKKFLIINSFDFLLGKKSDFTEIQINRLLRWAAERHSTGNGHLNISFSGGEYRVLGNAELIKTAVNNIVENATRYAKSYISISVSPDPEHPQEYLLISIENDGERIDEDTLDHFFDKYHKGRQGNFGLGLYITKRIMEFHEGDVWAENKKDGVRFLVRMERMKQEEPYS